GPRLLRRNRRASLYLFKI
ncbi:unnamed protein product, partial [Oikopleura dioica]